MSIEDDFEGDVTVGKSHGLSMEQVKARYIGGQRYKPPITCIVCGRELKPLYPDNQNPYGMIDGGMVGELYSPFGSRHDGIIFQVGVCDDCVERLQLKPIGNYMESDQDTAIRHEARMEKFKETGTYQVGGDDE